MAMNDINDANEDRERKRLGLTWAQYNKRKFGDGQLRRALDEIAHSAADALRQYGAAGRNRNASVLTKIAKLAKKR